MSQGLKISPAYFTALINEILSELLSNVLTYGMHHEWLQYIHSRYWYTQEKIVLYKLKEYGIKEYGMLL